MASTANLVFEIGTEEIPAAALYRATEQLAALATAALDEAGLGHGEVRSCSTPRRMILCVEDVAQATEALDVKAKGPAAAIAFDAEGNPTKAAEGFARGKGLAAADLVREVDEKGVEYVYAVTSTPAVPAVELLPGILEGLVKGLSWPRSMRWGTRHETFSRPVRWLVALLGSEVVPVQFAGLTAGRTTYGHRFLAPQGVEVACADDFFTCFTQMMVMPSAGEREASIRSQIAAVEAETGLRADTPAATFAEVVNLVEWPTVILAHFDEEFLQVPPEIITDAMLEHQRYFPLYRADGSLDNAFIVVGNGDPACTDGIRDGNERVVRARLADAAFFVEEDCRKPLEAYVAQLEQVVFQQELGSVHAKTERICKLAAALCAAAGVTGSERADAERAALLCKADLVTSAVVEFTSLQGVMGGHYARSSGEGEGVARAITDHYRPRYSGDEPPATIPGKVVAMADKLDTICGLFAIHQAPTGSSDPFALRRSALGILTILLGTSFGEVLAVPLAAAVDAALDAYEAQGLAFDRATTRTEVIDFIITRCRVMVRDAGNGVDAIDAVLAAGVAEPVEFVSRVRALERARADAPETFEDLATAFTRANNLADAQAGTACDVALMGADEQALLTAVENAEEQVDTALAAGDYASALDALASLRTPVDAFFEAVMVNDDDAALRLNRHRLLNRFTATFANVADVGKLAKR